MYVNQVVLILQPPQYKLDPRLARLLGVHTQTRASIMQALWLYIKHNKLQDSHEKEYINCNRYFRQVSKSWLAFLSLFVQFLLVARCVLCASDLLCGLRFGTLNVFAACGCFLCVKTSKP